MKKKLFIVGGAMLLALAIGSVGFVVGRLSSPPGSYEHTVAEEAGATVWTCSMHPQIRQPRPGKCPLCGMDLIPAAEDGGGEALGRRQLKLSPAAMELAEVETYPVERRLPTMEVRMVGKVEYDETTLSYITAWIPGRLDRLYVDYTGVPVQQGDHMVKLYSPELLAAQEELLQSIVTARELQASNSSLLQDRARSTVESAREKLRLWGLKEEQIAELEKRGTPTDHVTINAPAGGIVIHKNAQEGMYVSTGSRIYTIADLRRLWVKLDAYESDLKWLHYGQEVVFEAEAFPGETFMGRISFIDPVLSPTTRTAKLRVIVDNLDGRLKPEMFVRAQVRSQVAADGKVMDPDLAGKWISPMHPEVIKDGPGACDVCGMPLVKAEELGYLPANVGEQEVPLVIPASAPLITGKRAVVYVAVAGKPGVFEGREIVLGPRAGDAYIVEKGLSEGELVVTRGNFKLDSSVQLLAKPSMMDPEGVGGGGGHQHGQAESPVQQMTEGSAPTNQESFEVSVSFRKQLGDVVESYLSVQRALSQDDLEQAQAAAVASVGVVSSVDMCLLEGESHMAWMPVLKEIQTALEGISQAVSIDQGRRAFDLLSQALTRAVRVFGAMSRKPVYLVRCPMAFDSRGASWLQDAEEVRNPYFGSEMLECGAVQETLVDAETEEEVGHDH
jgi:Cu(I)/Ag(I) efflux system membrane fusion protein